MHNSKQWLPLGAILTDDGRLRQLPVRSYRQRTEWMNRNKDCSIIAFYNTGQGLFIDSNNTPVNGYHHLLWRWIRFVDFCMPSYFKVSEKKYGDGLDDLVPMQVMEHNPLDESVRVKLGTVWRPTTKRYSPCCCLVIHKFHIQFVSVRFGKVTDTLLVEQPLPMRLFEKSAYFLPTAQFQLLK